MTLWADERSGRRSDGCQPAGPDRGPRRWPPLFAGGHEAAAALGDYLIVVVNNDKQQILKKDKVILDEQNRMRLVRSLRLVDEVILAVDTDPPVSKTLKEIAQKYPDDELVFANGGDRNSDKVTPETSVCHELGIRMVYGIGSHEVEKRDSSTRINQALGHKK